MNDAATRFRLAAERAVVSEPSSVSKPNVLKQSVLKQSVLNPNLRTQSLARPLSSEEAAFAAGLEAAFASGAHEPAAIAAALSAAHIVRPGTRDTAWTAASLEETLRALNADLDQAYAEHGIGA